MNKGFFFDRDGIINELVNDEGKLRPPHKLDELKINNELIKTINLIKKQYLIFLVSNQPDVARGSLSLDSLGKINDAIFEKIEFKDSEFEINDNPERKKPNPYMINKLISKYALNSKESWLIGDRWVDIQAGRDAGLNTILLEKSYSYDPNSSGEMDTKLKANIVIKNYSDFHELIIHQFL